MLGLVVVTEDGVIADFEGKLESESDGGVIEFDDGGEGDREGFFFPAEREGY